jgi:hypothetical protein
MVYSLNQFPSTVQISSKITHPLATFDSIIVKDNFLDNQKKNPQSEATISSFSIKPVK